MVSTPGWRGGQREGGVVTTPLQYLNSISHKGQYCFIRLGVSHLGVGPSPVGAEPSSLKRALGKIRYKYCYNALLDRLPGSSSFR